MTIFKGMNDRRNADERPQRLDIHIHGLNEFFPAALHILERILHKLERLEQMPTLADLDTAVDNVQGVLTANDARVAALATAVSDASSRAAAHDAALDAEIKRLNDLLAAGGADPAAVQTILDKVLAMSAEGVTQGQGLDAATSALANAFPTASAPAPADPSAPPA